jgi:hypothetical protein
MSHSHLVSNSPFSKWILLVPLNLESFSKPGKLPNASPVVPCGKTINCLSWDSVAGKKEEYVTIQAGCIAHGDAQHLVM